MSYTLVDDYLLLTKFMTCRFDAWLGSIDHHEARFYYEARRLPLPSELSPVGKVTRNAAINDGDESDDALGKGKINFKNPDLEG